LELLELQKKANNKKFIISHLPKNLETLINGRKKIPYNGVNLKSAYLIDIVHNLIRKHLQNDLNSFNLYSKILKEKYGQKYNFYFKFLVENEILHMVCDYYVGKKSRSYLIPDETLKDISSYKNSDTVLLKKYKRLYYIDYLKKMNYKHIDLPIMVKLVKYIDQVDIKYIEAEKYLNSVKLNEKQRVKNFHSIKCLKHNDLWYNFDQYGRFHTNLTTLKSDIRSKYLLIDGSPTREIDIANSQPIFLTSLMSRYLEVIDIEEYEFFKQLVVNGSLYEYVSNHTSIKEKKEIKKIIYVVLFGTNHGGKTENKIFKSLFPSIFGFIKWYKKEEKKDYKALSHELQISESNLLFNNIIKEIIEKYPDLPFFTVHDSITVKDKDYDKVKKIFNKHIKKVHKEL